MRAVVDEEERSGEGGRGTEMGEEERTRVRERRKKERDGENAIGKATAGD